MSWSAVLGAGRIRGPPVATLDRCSELMVASHGINAERKQFQRWSHVRAEYCVDELARLRC